MSGPRQSLGVAVSGRRLAAVDGLRAVAALAVFGHHVGFDSGATFRGVAGDFLARGDIGVPIFFAISGFVIYRPYASEHAGSRAADSWRVFYRRRFLRIYPAYWLALAGTAVAFGMTIHSWKHAVALAGLLQIYRGSWALSGLPQAWSLCVEVSFYALVPLYAAVLARITRRAGDKHSVLGIELGGAAVLALASLVYRVVIYSADPDWAGTALFWLPAHLDLFAIGIALAAAAVHRVAHPVAFLERLADHPAMCSVFAGAAFLVTVFLLNLPKGIAWVPGPQAIARQTLYGIVAIGLLVPAVLGPPSGLTRRVTSWAPLVWAGVISYGIYLWHKSFVHEAVSWSGGQAFDANPWAVAALALPLTLVVAWFSHRLVEEPISARFGRRPVPKTDTADR